MELPCKLALGNILMTNGQACDQPIFHERAQPAQVHSLNRLISSFSAVFEKPRDLSEMLSWGLSLKLYCSSNV